jgi:hypothetical protein
VGACHQRNFLLMVLLDDKTYRETKDIRLGKSKRSPLLDEFSLWFSGKYSVEIVNFAFDRLTTPGINRHRLCVIIENTPGYQKMFTHPFEYNGVYQAEIADEFERLALKHKFADEASLEDLFVSFVDFSDEARTDANWKAAQEVQASLKGKYPFVWEVIAPFSGSVVFYHTNQEVETYNNNGVSGQITDEYYAILKKYDELGYFTKENISLAFDSQENLDKNYAGNLFYYTR